MCRKSNKYLALIADMTLISLTAGIGSAAPVTQSITYRGKLTNAAGNPLTGTYSVTFRICASSTGATVLSTDTHDVTAVNGLFTASIAVINPSVVQSGPLWLGIRVGPDPEMTPRQEIRPVPYALSLRPGALNQMTWIAANEPISAFDLNGNDRIDFADIVALFGEI